MLSSHLLKFMMYLKSKPLLLVCLNLYGIIWQKFPVATLQEELQQVQRYMTIQNIRFPGKFCYDINVPPEFLQMNLPVFLFQPLVENSVEHGFFQ